MLNSVLNAVMLFTFSFSKVPKVVIQEFINIQHEFLWNGRENIRRINWLAWSSIRLPKSQGGLGVEH